MSSIDPNYSTSPMDGDEVDLAQAAVYALVTRTRCQAMDAAFVLLGFDGTITSGEIGDYLCENILLDGSPGERFRVKQKHFSSLYRLAPPQKFAPAEAGEFGADEMRRNPLSVHYDPNVRVEDLR